MWLQAVGMGARFLKVGAPSRGERVAKLNRLVQIEAKLMQEGRLSTLQPLVFPNLTAPEPKDPALETEGQPASETASQTAGQLAEAAQQGTE